MSEIIFPSEIITPAEIDWENPIANALVNAGVGIFFTDDNLTTVTNVATGVAGTSTDITNNELGVANNEYRVGAVITGLTSEQQTSVTDNPYQLFKTKEKVQQEYGLFFDGDGNGLELSGFVGETTLHIKLADDIPNAVGASMSFIDGRRQKGSTVYNGTSSWVSYTNTGSFTWGADILGINIDGTPIVSNTPVTLDRGTIVSITLAANSGDTVMVGNRFDELNVCHKLGISEIKAVDTVTSYLWDFNQNSGDTVVDHYNGAMATLIGFNADSGYVRDDTTGQLVGYQFTGTTTATLLLTGVYTGTITYSNDTTLAISGSGNYVINTGIVKSVAATDTVGTFNWDGTTGDKNQIIDTVGNNHATITNASTDKWQPIIPVDVFTVGAGKDYSVLPDFWVARKGQAGISRAYLYEMDTATTTAMWGNAHTTDGFEIVAATGLESINGVPQVGIPNAKIYGYDIPHLLFRDVDVWVLARKDLKSYGCNIKVDYSGSALNSTWFIKDSIISSLRCSIDGCKLDVINCISLTSLSIGSSSTAVNATITNTLSPHSGVLVNTHQDYYNNGTRVFVGNTLVKHTTSLDNYIEDGGGNIQGKDFVGAFVDEVQGDYRINQAWADTNLVGQGWNGSDIASWAYNTLSGINLLKYGSSDILDIKYYNGAALVDVTLQVNGTIVWQV